MDVNDLDEVLKSLNNDKILAENIDDILQSLKNKGYDTDKLVIKAKGKDVDYEAKKWLFLILKKLVKDGYVEEYNENPPNVQYYINYDGVAFLAKGGYKWQSKSSLLDKRRKIILDYALILGSVGAILAVILALYDMYNASCC